MVQFAWRAKTGSDLRSLIFGKSAIDVISVEPAVEIERGCHACFSRHQSFAARPGNGSGGGAALTGPANCCEPGRVHVFEWED